MKVLLTNSPLQFYHIVTFLYPDCPALNLAMLAGAVEDFCEVKIVDNWHSKYKSDEDIWKALFDFKPHVLAISNSTVADTDCICELVKNVRAVLPSLITVSGGYGAMVRKSDLLRAGVDFIVDGEGELTFRELMKALVDKRGPEEIAGISYLDGNKEVSTPSRPFVDDIGSLPLPARQYLPRLKALFTPGYSSALEISRGCFFDCNFCSVTSFWKKGYRVKSVSRVLTEIDQILSLGCDQFYLTDDSFGLDVKKTYEMLQAFKDNNLKFKWITQIRSDTVAQNPDLIKLAGETGLTVAIVGFESYSDEDLKTINKQSSSGKNLMASNILKENNIVVFGLHIFGIPDQSFNQFNRSFVTGLLSCDVYRMSLFSPLPGTPLWEEYRKDGKLLLSEKLNPYLDYIVIGGRSRLLMSFLFKLYSLLIYFSPISLAKLVWPQIRRHDSPIAVMRRTAFFSLWHTLKFYMYRKVKRCLSFKQEHKSR